MRRSLPLMLLLALGIPSAAPGQDSGAAVSEERPTPFRLVRAGGAPWANARLELISRAQPWDDATPPERISLRADARGRAVARLRGGRSYSAFAWSPEKQGFVTISRLQHEVLPGLPREVHAEPLGLQRVVFELDGAGHWEGEPRITAVLRSATLWTLPVEVDEEGRFLGPVAPGDVHLEVAVGNRVLLVQKVRPLQSDLFTETLHLPVPVLLDFDCLDPTTGAPAPGVGVSLAASDYRHGAATGLGARLYLRQARVPLGRTDAAGRFRAKVPVARDEEGELEIHSLTELRLHTSPGLEAKLPRRLLHPARLQRGKEQWRITEPVRIRTTEELELHLPGVPAGTRFLAAIRIASRAPRWTQLLERTLPNEGSITLPGRSKAHRALLLAGFPGPEGDREWLDLSHLGFEDGELRFPLKNARRVRVRARYENGRPLRTGRLWVWRLPKATPAVGSGATPVLGAPHTFRRGGRAALRLAPGHYECEAWDGRLGCARSGSFEISAAGPAKKEVELLVPLPVRLEGRVLDAQGRPVAGAEVYTSGLSAIGYHRAPHRVLLALGKPRVHTDAKGSFLLKLPALPHRHVRLGARTHNSGTVLANWFALDRDAKGIEIRLER